ncbi:MAG: hypothetical protein KC416_02950 [Myxococcales bacterium]|nr:hypothetical protein [Myxococcales bacterium]
MATPSTPSPNPAAGIEQPQIKWKAIAQIGAVFAILWAISFGVVPWIGYWGVIIAGVLTLVALGFGLYIWRLTRKSRAIVDILKGATDEGGRQQALERLKASGKQGDAMNALAQAQLVARDKPGDAIEILEGVDLKKAPAVVQDDVRANLGMLYLMHNRTRDARMLADDIRLDRQPQPKSKAMYAAVIAEAFSRTGKPEEALKLLETYDADDATYGEVRAMLYRAQVYTYMASKKRGMAKTAMHRLGKIDPNMVAAFVAKGKDPELTKMARDLLQRQGAIPKQKMRIQRG